MASGRSTSRSVLQVEHLFGGARLAWQLSPVDPGAGQVKAWVRRSASSAWHASGVAAGAIQPGFNMLAPLEEHAASTPPGRRQAEEDRPGSC